MYSTVQNVEDLCYIALIIHINSISNSRLYRTFHALCEILHVSENFLYPMGVTSCVYQAYGYCASRKLYCSIHSGSILGDFRDTATRPRDSVCYALDLSLHQSRRYISSPRTRPPLHGPDLNRPPVHRHCRQSTPAALFASHAEFLREHTVEVLAPLQKSKVKPP